MSMEATLTLSQADVRQLLDAISDHAGRLREQIALFTDDKGELLPYLLKDDIRNHVSAKRAELKELHALRSRLISAWRPHDGQEIANG